MTDKVLKYRKRHRRCKYCKHLKVKALNGYYSFRCIAKDKQIRDEFPDMTNVPRVFCQCYEVDGKL